MLVCMTGEHLLALHWILVSASAGKYKVEGGTPDASVSAGQDLTGRSATPGSPTASEASTAHTAIVYSNVSPQGMAFAHGPFSPSPRPTHETAEEVQGSAAAAASEGSAPQPRTGADSSRSREPQQHTTPSSIPKYHGSSIHGWDEDGEEVDSKLGAIRTSRGGHRAPEIVPSSPAGTPAVGRPGSNAQPGTVMVALGAQQTVKGTPPAARGLAPLMVDTGGQGLPIIPEAPNTGNSTSAANHFRLSQILSPVASVASPPVAAQPAAATGPSQTRPDAGPAAQVS
jgi:hypothetical protein